MLTYFSRKCLSSPFRLLLCRMKAYGSLSTIQRGCTWSKFQLAEVWKSLDSDLMTKMRKEKLAEISQKVLKYESKLRKLSSTSSIVTFCAPLGVNFHTKVLCFVFHGISAPLLIVFKKLIRTKLKVPPHDFVAIIAWSGLKNCFTAFRTLNTAKRTSTYSR